MSELKKYHKKLFTACVRKAVDEWRKKGKRGTRNELFEEAWRYYQEAKKEEAEALLVALVARGEVEVYVKNGTTYVRPTKKLWERGVRR